MDTNLLATGSGERRYIGSSEACLSSSVRAMFLSYLSCRQLARSSPPDFTPA